MTTFLSSTAHVELPGLPDTAAAAYGLFVLLVFAAFVTVQGFQSVGGILQKVIQPSFYLALFLLLAVVVAAR
ncbi:MAG: hypothetical protein AAGA93_00215 [Actinomycetota bacterium]